MTLNWSKSSSVLLLTVLTRGCTRPFHFWKSNRNVNSYLIFILNISHVNVIITKKAIVNNFTFCVFESAETLQMSIEVMVLWNEAPTGQRERKQWWSIIDDEAEAETEATTRQSLKLKARRRLYRFQAEATHGLARIFSIHTGFSHFAWEEIYQDLHSIYLRIQDVLISESFAGYFEVGKMEVGIFFFSKICIFDIFIPYISGLML